MSSTLRMDIRRLVGANVRRYRAERGLSQEEIGARMGVDRPHVGLIEGGEQNATLLTIWSLSQTPLSRPAVIIKKQHQSCLLTPASPIEE